MIFERKSISETKRLLACTERQAFFELEVAAKLLVKQASWYPYHSKVRSLQKPLLQLRLARKGNGS